MKVLTLKTEDELIAAATEMQIMLTASGHNNVISYEEAFYSDFALLARPEAMQAQCFFFGRGGVERERETAQSQ